MSGDAVAKYIFETSDGSFLCTGQLLNTLADELFFLTAATA